MVCQAGLQVRRDDQSRYHNLKPPSLLSRGWNEIHCPPVTKEVLHLFRWYTNTGRQYKPCAWNPNGWKRLQMVENLMFEICLFWRSWPFPMCKNQSHAQFAENIGFYTRQTVKVCQNRLRGVCLIIGFTTLLEICMWELWELFLSSFMNFFPDKTFPWEISSWKVCNHVLQNFDFEQRELETNLLEKNAVREAWQLGSEQRGPDWAWKTNGNIATISSLCVLKQGKRINEASQKKNYETSKGGAEAQQRIGRPATSNLQCIWELEICKLCSHFRTTSSHLPFQFCVSFPVSHSCVWWLCKLPLWSNKRHSVPGSRTLAPEA